MRALAPEFKPYAFALPTDEVARLAGIDPSQVLRFDQNTPPLPLASTRPGAIAGALARVSGYPAGGYRELRSAIADYAGVEPENVVLGAGADDLILLCARAYAGPGDTIAVPAAPTYPLFRIAAQLAGAEIGDADPVLTFACRPNNPTGELGPLPDARPLVVDEAYFEYSGVTAVDLLDDGVIVLRTFSKLFALAGARIGYALAARETADELNGRQAPAPISTLSAALAVAALAEPPDPSPVLEERERLAASLRALGLAPLESHGNFLYVPVEDGLALNELLLRQGLVVRAYPEAIRVSVLDAPDDDMLVEALARALDRPAPVAAGGGRRARTSVRPPRRGSRCASRSTVRAACASPRAPGSTTTFSSSSRFTPASISSSKGPAISRPATTTPPRTQHSRSVQRSMRRSATGAGSRVTATRSCRWTTRLRARRSTSAAVRMPS